MYLFFLTSLTRYMYTVINYIYGIYMIYYVEYVGEDDELFLGIQAPRYLERCIYIDMHFVAAHMAFTCQREKGFDETPFLQKYADLVKNLV